MKSYCP